MAVLPVQNTADCSIVNQDVGGIEVPVDQPALGLQLFQPPGFPFHYLLDPDHGFLADPCSHVGLV